MKYSRLAMVFAVATLCVGPVLADMTPPYHVSVDISSIVGSDLELELALYNNSGLLYDSYAIVDNVRLAGVTMADFESGTLDGFDDSLNPGSVGVVPGNLCGGSLLMEVDEDPVFSSTIAFRDFLGSSATSLEFDLQMEASTTVGFWGLDEFVVNVLDPLTLNSLLPEIFPGGGILSLTAGGLDVSGVVDVTVIPAPGAALLGVIGLGCVGSIRCFRRGKA